MYLQYTPKSKPCCTNMFFILFNVSFLIIFSAFIFFSYSWPSTKCSTMGKFVWSEECLTDVWETRCNFINGYYNKHQSKQPIKIYDTFLFSNELSLLRVRLVELYDNVDYFFLIESQYSHSGNIKPLYYEENKQYFTAWQDKIVHIIVNDSKWAYNSEDIKSEVVSFRRQKWQTEALYRSIRDHGISDTDYVLYSSLDEIPKRSLMESFRKCSGYPSRLGITIDPYIYNFHCRGKNPVSKLRFWRWDQFKEVCADTSYQFDQYLTKFKELILPPSPLCFDDARLAPVDIQFTQAGWHLSFFSNESENIVKMSRMAHVSRNTPENRKLMRNWMEFCIHPKGEHYNYLDDLPCRNELPTALDILSEFT